MKFLFCKHSPEDNEAIDENSNPRSCLTSIRKLFNRNGNKKRVSISGPVPMTKEQVAQVQGLIEERSPLDQEKKEDPVVVETTNQEIGSGELSKIDAETITDPMPMPTGRNDFNELLHQVWYWGDISRRDAEHLLRGQEEGTFLVRNSSDKRFLYSLSFRSNGKTLHTRIECAKGLFFFYLNNSNAGQDDEGAPSLIDLISDAMNQDNAENIFFYSRGLNKNETSMHTVTLARPLSRFRYVIDYNYSKKEPKALQYLCKFIIHHSPKNIGIDSVLKNEITEFINESMLFPGNKTTRTA